MNTYENNDYGLTPTLYEQEQQRNAIIIKENDRRERIRIRRDNAARGFDQPKPGDKLHVQLDGSAGVRRTRAGIKFERGVRVTVEVVDMSEEDVRDAQAGRLSPAELAKLPDESTREWAARVRVQERNVVSVYGAEQILEDSALHIYQHAPAADEEALEALRARNLQLEEEIRASHADRAELARLRREARMNAPDTNDGRPTRLRAADAVGPAPKVDGPLASIDTGSDIAGLGELEFGSAAPVTGDAATSVMSPGAAPAPSRTTTRGPAPTDPKGAKK